VKTVKYLFILFVFISLNSSAQSWLWARQGTTNSDLTAVAEDAKGNVYITAAYFDSITFGSHHLFTSSGGDSYVVKYDSLGNVLWITQPKTTGVTTCYVYANSNTVDINGDLYITGQFSEGIAFGAYALNSVSGGHGGYDAFLAKYDANGNVLWATQSTNNWGTNQSAYGIFVTTDMSGNVYETGLFEDSVAFGTDTVKTTVVGNNNVYIVKYDTKGSVLWAKQANLLSAASSAYGYSESTDQFGNLYLTGAFSGSITFGSDTLSAIYSLPVTSLNIYDIFLVKYDSNGNVLWAKQGNIPSSASGGVGYSVLADKVNSIYLTGYFHDTLVFDGDTLNQQNAKSSGLFYGDIFLAKLTPNGNLIWMKHSTSSSDTIVGWCGYSLSIDEHSHIYMTAGGFDLGAGTISFGIDTFAYNPATEKDPAIAMELDTAGNVLCFSNVISGGDDQSLLVTDPSGKYVYWGGDFWNTSVVLGKDTEIFYPNSDEYPFIARWQSCTPPIDSNQLPVTQEPCNSLFIPNAFSPNKDGQNDILYVRGDCISTMDFIVYDRWGAKVFESTNINNGWDGTYKGKPMNTASFAYYLKAVLLNGTTIEKKGNVALVR
jgi:gliding motility-associated-like protein